MLTFILTLIISLITGAAFVSYKHPLAGKKISFFGCMVCIIIMGLVEVFNVGYSSAAIQYFKLDKKRENIDFVNNLFSEGIFNTRMIVGITGLSFVALYLLTVMIFQTINDDKDGGTK